MTTIEWTYPPGYKGESWNFITGCTLGCGYCYAAKIAKRFWGDRPFSNVQFHPDRLSQPSKWRKPRCIFVNSMGDWADPLVETVWIKQGFQVMLDNPRHIYILLTKQPGLAAIRLQDMFGMGYKLPSNIWLGVSVENQAAADYRREAAERMAEYASVSWVSYEPAIGHVKWSGWEFIKWLVIGGMSGDRDVAPFYLHWGEGAIAWCRANGVYPFVKQLGSNPMVYWHGKSVSYDGKGKNNAIENFPEKLQVREYPLSSELQKPGVE